jgi:hypothetical protein
VVVVVSGVLEHETSVRPTTATTPLNNIAFFIDCMVCSQTNSSQVASADVLGDRIILLKERTNPDITRAALVMLIRLDLRPLLL